MEYFKVTDDTDEMARIGRLIAADKASIYTPLMMEKMMEGVESHIPDAPEAHKEQMVYRAIYDYWAYGNNVDEEFYLDFCDKTHEQKLEYMVGKVRRIYVDHLNSGGGTERLQLLEDKYRAYRRLERFYKRDVIQIAGEADFATFEAFVAKHPVYVVKPSDYYYGIGVHKASLDEFGGDARAAFDQAVSEGAAVKERHPSRESSIVVEELIEQDESLAALHPESVNGIRATAVRGADGAIHIWHPWIKVGINGTFVASAALDGFDAEIDPGTGVIVSDGYQEDGSVYEVHPDSGIRIKGFQIPRWGELVDMVGELMEELPEYGYIGWDLVLSKRGWCVIEANYSGEFTFQLINGRGMKREFEELIGWKCEKEFWWD